MTTTPTGMFTSVKRHPVRGAIYGLLLGLGVAVYLVLFSVVTFGDWVLPVIVVVACILIGVLWGLFAPAKKPKGYRPEPESATVAAAVAVEESPTADDIVDEVTTVTPEAAGDAVGDVGAVAEEVGGDVGHAASDVAGEVTEDAADVAGDAASDAAGDIGDAAADIGDAAADIGDAAADIGDAAADFGEEATET